ncbi:MAG: signal recognition particle-docking protein FtsY [Chitinivibrionales bacterium]
MNILSRLKDGLSKTRSHITAMISGEDELDDSFFETLEDALISADVSIELSLAFLDQLQDEIEDKGITTPREAYSELKKMLTRHLSQVQKPLQSHGKPWVMLVVGVNGVGKTTTIGKLAHEYRENGSDVMLGAADTFRAGAIEQLKIWAQRTDSSFISQQEGADPASVAFDAIQSAQARKVDMLILDTAGRLHSKTNLMNELEKIVRVIRRQFSEAPHEVWLVLDATTGQNAIRQAEVFNKIIGVTGLVITKLDGTSKGGIAFSLAKKLSIPIRKIGVGEGIDDLQDFDADAYVEAMFGDLEF